MVVYVAGAVSEPDVYRLPAGSRVDDAVQRAGGPTAAGRGRGAQPRGAAHRRAANRHAQPGPPALPGLRCGSGGAGTADAPIGLGTATVEELDTIEGIGPVTAQKIIEFRDQHGGTSSVDQLDQIDGIGPATMDALRARLQP